MNSLVIDLGGTFVKMGIIRGGEVLEFKKIPSHSGCNLEGLLDEITDFFHQFKSKHHLELTDFRGIGMAVPGIIDFNEKRVLSINKKYEQAIEFEFEKWAREVLNLPIVLENDAKAALVGEIGFGSAKNETDAVLMTFGTGIGTAVFINNQLLRGKHHQAGCLGGHLTTQSNHFACTCGNTGCVEASSSNWAMPIVAKERSGFDQSLLAQEKIIDYYSVIQCAKQQDPFSVAFLNYLLDQWSTGITNMIHAYDPEVVILSGGLMNAKESVLPELQKRVKERTWTPWGDVRFIVAEHPEKSVLLGLEALLMQQSN
ncbi:ROK family protein [Priestia megaterium]|nr:ROK family protein [Priestia megaterium]